MKNAQKYLNFIKDNFLIVTKDGEIKRFDETENHWRIQSKFILEDATGRDTILKARQMGLSSVILALFAVDFIAKPNSYSMVVADKSDNAEDLLARVKFYLKSFEEKNKVKLLLKYNSKYELYNEEINSTYKIGTAENREVGRSKSIFNLHLSEFAFYPDPEAVLRSALQAVVPRGKIFIETTANGFNFFKTFWEECKQGLRDFNPIFYGASQFYSKEFLERKKKELKGYYLQEYPDSDIESFIASGELYFAKESLKWYLDNVREPIKEGVIYI
ncbi:MAG: hypothetical protein KatS3mg101_0942 [Patescibacteria group bacterium]|nr:MAG: hypothetical protein KatS3mg101_0942 [Patescibacteria group bacterium]